MAPFQRDITHQNPETRSTGTYGTDSKHNKFYVHLMHSTGRAPNGTGTCQVLNYENAKIQATSRPSAHSRQPH